MRKLILSAQAAWHDFSRTVNARSGSIAIYAGVFISATLGPVWVHRLKLRDLTYPWRVVDSDLSSAYSLAQAVGQSWFGLVHHSLGAPFTADLSFAFIPDDLQIEMIRILTHLTHDPFVAVNFFYLLTFGLCANTFLFLTDQFKISRWISAPLALSYAWLPYHFTRMDAGHVALAAYYMIPVGVIYLHRLFEYLTDSREFFFPRTWLRKFAFTIGIIAVGSSGAYYGVFFALLAATMIILAPHQSRTVPQVVQRSAEVCITSVFFILAPLTRILISQFRGLETVLTRSPEESVQFGGSISRLLVPWGTWLPEKMLPLVSKMEYEWNASPLLGVIGVWILVLRIFLTLAKRDFKDTGNSINFIFLWSLLLYVASGFGLVFAYGINSSFRCWNRLSVVIMTIALLALARFVSQIKFSYVAKSILLVVIALFTQLTPLKSAGIGIEPDETSKTAFNSLQIVAEFIQREVEPGCRILQLPIMEFPEGGQVGQVGNGNHLWLPLLTDGFHWSYGAPKGTFAGDYWTSHKLGSIEAIAQKASDDSFCAILLDRRSGADFNPTALSPYISSKTIGEYVLFTL
jgi:phosphoglycerol transferase